MSDSPDIYNRHQRVCERTNECRTWAKNRIACCDAALTGRNGDVSRSRAYAYEQEKRTLEAVLRILNGEETPT